jgi:ectoine hydroxylase-related dioxygenase (phytanoyl-CoA dioxygenase family)
LLEAGAVPAFPPYPTDGELNKVPHADERLWKEYQMRAQQACMSAGLSVLDVCVSAGDTIIWHPHTLHGGRFISDQSRSRLSLVIHTTPPNQAVFHNEGFFNPEAVLSEFYDKLYLERNGRSYVPYQNVSFGHVLEVPAKNLEG